MMEMKCNKTNEEPEKQNASARKRVALEEEDRVKLDRWMTEPVLKVRSGLCFHNTPIMSIHHVIHLQCHHVINSLSWSTASINHAIHYPCHPLTMPSIINAIH